MSNDLGIGDAVEWDWGDGTANGKIVERFTHDVTKTIKGSEITRHAADDEPAFLIEQDDGDEVLKGVNEVRPV